MPAPFPTRAFRRTRDRASGQLLAFGIDDLSLSAPTGQTLTFDRNSSRTVYDSAGRVTTLAYDQAPWSAVYNASEAVWEPVLAPHRAATNLCLQSENFGTTWSAIGTPTRTAAAAKCGDLSLDLLGDDAAGTLEGYSQVITFTGNAVKAVALFVKQGTSTSSVIRLRDTTGSANRLLATVTWSSGVPAIAMTTGTHIESTPCYGGVYRLLFQTTSVTAANTNQIEIYPATTSALAVANTGTLYVGGVMLQNAIWPNAYIKTTTATVTTAADYLTAPVNWAPQDFTAYVRAERMGYLALSTGGGIGGLFGMDMAGLAGFSTAFTTGATATLVASISDGTTAVSGSQTIPAGSVFEAAIQFANVTTAPKVRIDCGASFGSYSSTTGPIAAWGSSVVSIGSGEIASAAPIYALDGGLRRVIFAPGARTLAEMRGLSV